MTSVNLSIQLYIYSLRHEKIKPFTDMYNSKVFLHTYEIHMKKKPQMYNTCILIYVYSMKKVQMLHMCVCVYASFYTHMCTKCF